MTEEDYNNLPDNLKVVFTKVMTLKQRLEEAFEDGVVKFVGGVSTDDNNNITLNITLDKDHDTAENREMAQSIAKSHGMILTWR